MVWQSQCLLALWCRTCREKERIAFNYLTSQKYAGEHADLDVWREEQEVQLTVQLMRPRLLVPLHLTNSDPSFFVVAGIIFTVLSEPYLLSEYGVDYMSEAPVKLLEHLMHGERVEADEQVWPVFRQLDEGYLGPTDCVDFA